MAPGYGFALLAAVLWAVSSPVLNRTLQSLPAGADRRSCLLLGLGLSLSVGSVALVLAVGLVGGGALPQDPLVALAGVFTFPVATGLYYFAGEALGRRFEIASQAANAKPVFSLAFAVALLGERLTPASWAAAALTLAGVGLLALGGRAGQFAWAGLGLGLLTALAWSLGELCMVLAPAGAPSLEASAVALASGTAVAALPIAITLRRVGPPPPGAWLLGFAAHGVLSFGLAYTLFFHSLRTVGLASTILITAFWPALALVLRTLVERGRPPVSPLTWLAAALLLGGSLVHIVGGGFRPG